MASSRSRVALGVVVVAALGAGVAALLGGRGPADVEAEAAPAEAAPTAVGAGALASAGARPEGRAAGSAARTAVLVGTVRRDGRPVAARVEVRVASAPPAGAPPGAPSVDPKTSVPPAGGGPPPAARVAAGDDGRFEVAVPVPATCEVVAVGADGAVGRAPASLEADGSRVVVAIDLHLGTERLAGRVVHADGRPFEGLVAAVPGPAEPRGAVPEGVPVGGDGRFVLERLPVGPCTLLAYRPGELGAWSRPILLPHPADVTLVVDAGMAALAGRVVADADGRPVAGARVVASVWGTPGLALFEAVAVTDATGAFRLAAGPGTGLSVDAAGFVDAYRSVSSAGGPVEVRLVRVARLSGRVTRAADAAPVADVGVYAFDGTDAVAAAWTGADGAYAMPDVPPGTVTVLALGAGHTTVGARGWAGDGGYDPFAVTVPPDGAVVVDLVVEPAGVVTGTVVDADGAPVAAAAVAPGRTGPGPEALRVLSETARSATDAAGRFRCDALLLDTSYAFTATAPDGRTARALQVRVEAGVVPDLTLRLDPLRRGTARCVTSSGTPVVGADVYVYRAEGDDWGWVGNFTTGPTGVAELVPLPDARLHVAASVEGYRARNGSSSSAVVEPTADGAVDVELVLDPAPVLRGTVQWAGGELASGVRVKADYEGGQSMSWVGDDGVFDLALPAVVDVEVSVRMGDDTVLETTARPGDVPLTLTIPRPRPPRWRFRVLTADGRPVASAYVRARGASYDDTGRVEHGDVDFSKPTEPVSVLVLAPRQSSGLPASSGWVVVGPVADAAAATEVRLPPERAITGRVRDGAGRPVRGVGVVARAVLPPPFDDVDEDAASARTDAEGRFRLGGLGDGLHRLRVHGPASASDVAERTVPAGAEDVEFVLTAAVETPVVVLDADGRPVAVATVTIESDGDDGRTVAGETDGLGVARLRDVDPTARWTLAVDPPAAREDCLGARQPGWRPDGRPVVLGRGLAVGGVVRDAAGRPVPFAAVERLGPEDADPPPLASTGRDGGFRLTRLPDGPVRLLARSRDRTLVSEVVETRAGADGVVLRLAATGSLRIVLEGYVGVADPPTFDLVDEATGERVQSDAAVSGGVASVHGLRRGGTYRCYEVLEQPGGDRVATATGLRADAGTVTVPLVAARAVRGRVVVPADADDVNVWASRGDAVRHAPVADDGTFTLDGLVEGGWTLRASVTRDGPRWDATADVTVGPDGASGIVLEPRPPPR